MATATRDSSGGRLVALTLLALVALAGAGYVGLAWYIADKVPHATFVQGVDIGGLSRSAAEQRLRESLAQHADRPVVLTWRHRDFRITPASAGLSIDYAATVDAAGSGFSLEPGRIWRYFSGGGEVRAVAGVAEPAMRSTLARLARTVQQRPVEGTIRFEAGKARPVWARAGRRLDLGAARELLVHGFLTGGRERLPVVPDEPYVSAAAVATAMHRFAQPAMSAPVVLVVGGESIIATPAEYSAALAVVPQGHELRPVVDGQRLLRAIRPAMTTVGDKPRNARFRLVRGRPTVVPARIGATFDVEDLAARFPRYLVRPVGRRRMQVKAVVQQPRFTTAEATALRVDHVVSRATAPLYDRSGAAGAARTTAGEVSGRLVHPHRLLVLSAPGSTTDPAVSQVASTLYTAAFDAGLEVVERTSLPHYRSDFALGVDA
ncbi:MAG TPA: peptidoglycan binding domain-containing protein, partial [Marmoricola sp.]